MDSEEEMGQATERLSVEIKTFYGDRIFTTFFTDWLGFGQFMNFGYWEDGIDTPAQAGENLVRRLLEFVPEKNGPILDVACGKAASTALLKNYFPAAQITGINVSEKQLEKCRENAPGCTFLLMDAANLDFDDETFETVLCVEAAFHFDTRQKFLEEALRVLKPGGHLVVSDVLMTRDAERTRGRHIEANYVAGLEAYDALVEQVGFDSVEVIDATKPCWHAYYWHWVEFFHRAYLNREIKLAELKNYLEGNYQRVPILNFYLLAHAQKPV